MPKNCTDIYNNDPNTNKYKVFLLSFLGFYASYLRRTRLILRNCYKKSPIQISKFIPHAYIICNVAYCSMILYLNLVLPVGVLHLHVHFGTFITLLNSHFDGCINIYIKSNFISIY